VYNAFQGLLFIGDPHIASKIPGFRKDDYMEAILKKLEYALCYAKEHQLLPVILGDLFHWPRDNATRLLTQLMRLFENHLILSVTGNHDTTEQTLQDDDSLAVLAAAHRIYLLDRSGPWKGTINSVPIVIGGSAWSDRIPTSFDHAPNTLILWITHHNICFSNSEMTGMKPQELLGIHLVINGHIHRPLPQETHGMTTWINPGNISRVQRSESVRTAIPSALKLTPLNLETAVRDGKVMQDFESESFERGDTHSRLVKGSPRLNDSDSKSCITLPSPTAVSRLSTLTWLTEDIPLPHEPFENVFYPMNEANALETCANGSAFIQGLEELESMRTSGGAGLIMFIHNNISLFEKEIADVILNLVKEVCPDEFH
jgi:predicted phosphodiesterase